MDIAELSILRRCKRQINIPRFNWKICDNWTFDKFHGTRLDMNYSAAHSLLLSTFA